MKPETKPAETKPAETKPVEAKPEEKKASEKAEARKAKEKKLRAVKVEYKAKGAVITVVAKTSPKKTGSKAREIWDLYKDGMTVEDLLKAAEATKGGAAYAKACMIWDTRHGFITVGPAAAPATEPKAEENAA